MVQFSTDPRYRQLLFLAGFWLTLFHGQWGHHLPHWLTLAGLCLGLETLLRKMTRRWAPGFFLSPLITATALHVLLRTSDWEWMGLASVLAIGSKFVFRTPVHHFFNPANFGITTLLLLGAPVWVSQGQWQFSFLAMVGLVAFGGLGLFRHNAYQPSLGFLSVFLGLYALRLFYLGEPWGILEHQLMQTSFWIFSILMISDPKSTPIDSKAAFGFGAMVGLLAFGLRYGLYLPDSIFYALFFISPFTPLLDKLGSSRPAMKEVRHEIL